MIIIMDIYIIVIEYMFMRVYFYTSSLLYLFIGM